MRAKAKERPHGKGQSNGDGKQKNESMETNQPKIKTETVMESDRCIGKDVQDDGDKNRNTMGTVVETGRLPERRKQGQTGGQTNTSDSDERKKIC